MPQDLYTSELSAMQAQLAGHISLRPYQREALASFLKRFERWQASRPLSPLHVLFQMATGSGKTVVMAALMNWLYRKGYRQVVFFVNSTTILQKTKENFLDKGAPKYLFAPVLTDGLRPFRIQEGFAPHQAKGCMQLYFTTIQGLHVQIVCPKENGLSLQDFTHEKCLFISDEAHHLNTATKKRQSPTLHEDRSWEKTVAELLKQHPHHILLEFTATAGLENAWIAQKYHDKLLFNYSLATFRRQGYAKEVQVVQEVGKPMKRALQALLISYYRQLLFERIGVHSKPLVLFKSRTIASSRSFQGEFNAVLHSLSVKSLHSTMQSLPEQLSFLPHALQHLGSTPEILADQLPRWFGLAHQLVVDSERETEMQQSALNRLEQPDNPYRLIFAVDKLNEGWDVLNLFDIVRLYQTRQAQLLGRQPATVAEAQLIGRGARYFPFAWEASPPDRRKFDHAPEQPLRWCERLCYHTAAEPAYLQQLSQGLTSVGLLPAKGEKSSPTPPTATSKPSAADHARQVLADFKPTLGMPPHQLQALGQMTAPVLRKALDRHPFFTFENISHYFPGYLSVSAFIEGVLSGLQFNDTAKKPGAAHQQLEVASLVLEALANRLQQT